MANNVFQHIRHGYMQFWTRQEQTLHGSKAVLPQRVLEWRMEWLDYVTKMEDLDIKQTVKCANEERYQSLRRFA